jgi:hypothetical protein
VVEPWVERVLVLMALMVQGLFEVLVVMLRLVLDVLTASVAILRKGGLVQR